MELLNPKDAAAYLQISTNTLATWRHERRGPSFIRTGRVIRYSRKDLDDYLRRRRVRIAKNQ